MQVDISGPGKPKTEHRVVFVPSGSGTVPNHYIRRGTAAMPGRTLVLLHGISRNAAELAARFAAAAVWDEWTLIAPVFDKEHFGQFQQMLAAEEQTPSDQALTALLDRVFDDAGIDPHPVHIFGFSGGAQLAHRFAMLHPHKAAGVFAMAAGWYLMPDDSLPYPYGMGDPGPARSFDLLRALTVPMVIAVGALDTRCDNVVRQDRVINRMQGRNRYIRARKWHKAVNRVALERGILHTIALQVIANGTHNFGQCVEETDLLDRVHTAFAGGTFMFNASI